MSLVDSDLDSLADPFKAKAYRLVNLIATRGLPFRVFETRRSFTRTQQLFAQGRDIGPDGLVRSVDHSKVVSNARPGESPHGWGLALDAVLVTQHDHPFWDGHEDELPKNPWDLGDTKRPVIQLAWQRYWQSIRDCELVAGADWSGWKDFPHCEVRQWETYRPADWKAVVLRELALGH